MNSQLPDLDIEKTEAVTKLAESIGSHQPVKREGLPGSTCRNHVCAAQGTILLTLGDIHRHQAVVAVNDLISTLRFDREMDLEEDGVSGDDREDDFTFSLLTDLLDASPAGRNYADRSERRRLLEARAIQKTEAAARPSTVDPRIAPAVNTFRREMADEGILTSIAPVLHAMKAALAAADEAGARRV